MADRVDYRDRVVVLDGQSYQLVRGRGGEFAVLDGNGGKHLGKAIVGVDGNVTWDAEVVERVVMAWVAYCLIQGLPPWPGVTSPAPTTRCRFCNIGPMFPPKECKGRPFCSVECMKLDDEAN